MEIIVKVILKAKEVILQILLYTNRIQPGYSSK